MGITPALLLRFFGKSIELPFVELVAKLSSKVLLPVGKWMEHSLLPCCFHVRLRYIITTVSKLWAKL